MVVVVVKTDGEESYEVRGLTADQAEKLSALADFPLWERQPDDIGTFCEELFNTLAESNVRQYAETSGMTPDVTV